MNSERLHARAEGLSVGDLVSIPFPLPAWKRAANIVAPILGLEKPFGPIRQDYVIDEVARVGRLMEVNFVNRPERRA